MNSFLQKCILAAGTCLLLSVGSAAEAESDMTGFLRSSKEFQAWAFVCQPEKGKLFLKKTDANTYRSYLLKVNGGEIRMLHDDPDPEVQYQGIFLTRHPGLIRSGVLVAEWEAAVLKNPEKPGAGVFQTVMIPENNEGKIRFQSAVQLRPDGIKTRLGMTNRAFPAGEYHKFRAALDPENGNFALWMDDELLQKGVLPVEQNPPSRQIAFGDCSGGIAGQAGLRFFRIGVFQKIPEPLLKLKTTDPEWAFCCKVENGGPVLQKIDANSYRKDLMKTEGSLLHLIHDDPDPAVQYQGVFLSGHPGLKKPGILVAEWKAAVRKAAAKPETAVFNAYFAPAGKNGVCKFQTNVFLSPDGVKSKLGTAVRHFAEDEFHIFRIALDPDNGDCIIWMDGALLQYGKLPAAKPARQQLAFGDCSGAVEGQAVLEFFRIGRVNP